MTIRNRKKVAWITGASSGIASATVKLLLKNKYIIYASDNRSKNMDDLAELGVHIIKIDPLNDGDMQGGIDEIIANDGRIDLLINGSGFAFLDPDNRFTPQEAQYQYQNSLLDWSRLIELALPYMKKQKTGKIINVVPGFYDAEPLLHENYNCGKKLIRTLSIIMREKAESSGVTAMTIDASMQAQSSSEANPACFGYNPFGKLLLRAESLKTSILNQIFINGQTDEVFANLLLDTIMGPRLDEILEKGFPNVIPFLFKEIPFRKKMQIVKTGLQ